MKTSCRTWLVLTSAALLAAMASGSSRAAVMSRDWDVIKGTFYFYE